MAPQGTECVQRGRKRNTEGANEGKPRINDNDNESEMQ